MRHTGSVPQHPRQMAHRIGLGQWHCSFDIIPKHWHSLQYPLQPSLHDQITPATPPSPMCDAAGAPLLLTQDQGFKQAVDWRLLFSGAQARLLSLLFRAVYGGGGVGGHMRCPNCKYIFRYFCKTHIYIIL